MTNSGLARAACGRNVGTGFIWRALLGFLRRWSAGLLAGRSRQVQTRLGLLTLDVASLFSSQKKRNTTKQLIMMACTVLTRWFDKMLFDLMDKTTDECTTPCTVLTSLQVTWPPRKTLGRLDEHLMKSLGHCSTRDSKSQHSSPM